LFFFVFFLIRRRDLLVVVDIGSVIVKQKLAHFFDDIKLKDPIEPRNWSDERWAAAFKQLCEDVAASEGKASVKRTEALLRKSLGLEADVPLPNDKNITILVISSDQPMHRPPGKVQRHDDQTHKRGELALKAWADSRRPDTKKLRSLAWKSSSTFDGFAGALAKGLGEIGFTVEVEIQRYFLFFFFFFSWSLFRLFGFFFFFLSFFFFSHSVTYLGVHGTTLQRSVSTKPRSTSPSPLSFVLATMATSSARSMENSSPSVTFFFSGSAAFTTYPTCSRLEPSPRLQKPFFFRA
jgi:hypothetical protein